MNFEQNINFLKEISRTTADSFIIDLSNLNITHYIEGKYFIINNFIDNDPISIKITQNEIAILINKHFIYQFTHANVNVNNNVSNDILINRTLNNDSLYVYTLSYKNQNIAHVYYTKNGILLNSIFYNHIYLENYNSIIEQYHKLRIYPNDVIVDINGSLNKQNVTSIILTNSFVKYYEHELNIGTYLVQIIEYTNMMFGYLYELFVVFNSGSFNIVDIDEHPTTELIRNNLDTSEDDDDFFTLGKRFNDNDLYSIKNSKNRR